MVVKRTLITAVSQSIFNFTSEDEFDKAVRTIQRVIGQPHGDIAGQHFPDEIREEWPRLRSEDRAAAFRTWLRVEAAHAPEVAWCVGPVEAVLKGGFTAGPLPDFRVAKSYAGEGDMIVGFLGERMHETYQMVGGEPRPVVDDLRVAFLSPDARAVLASVWMNPRNTLNFAMRESRPTEQARAAFDELVGAGLLRCETGEDRRQSFTLTDIGAEADRSPPGLTSLEKFAFVENNPVRLAEPIEKGFEP